MLSTIRRRISFFAGPVLNSSVVPVEDSKLTDEPQVIQSTRESDAHILRKLLSNTDNMKLEIIAGQMVGYMSDAGMEEMMKLSVDELSQFTNLLQKVRKAFLRISASHWNL